MHVLSMLSGHEGRQSQDAGTGCSGAYLDPPPEPLIYVRTAWPDRPWIAELVLEPDHDIDSTKL